MKDFVPLGSGDSRYLKSVSNFKTLYPTFEAFSNALIAGTLPIDLNGVNPAGVAQMGTPLNKANLLTDYTAAELGLSEDPTVDDALLAVTGVANWHVWESSATGYVSSTDPSAYPQDGEIDGVHYKYVKQMGEAGAKIETGSYAGTGTYGSSNPNSLTFGFEPKVVAVYGYWQSNVSRYFDMTGTSKSNNNIAFIPMSILTTSYTSGIGFTYRTTNNPSCYMKKSADGKTISWYHNSGATEQCNDSEFTFYYMAIG